MGLLERAVPPLELARANALFVLRLGKSQHGSASTGGVGGIALAQMGGGRSHPTAFWASCTAL